jgi:hypothetical protein
MYLRTMLAFELPGVKEPSRSEEGKSLRGRFPPGWLWGVLGLVGSVTVIWSTVFMLTS